MRADNGQFLPGTHWRPEAPHWDAIWLRHWVHSRANTSREFLA